MEKEFEKLDRLIDKEENDLEKKLLLQYKQSLKTIQATLGDIFAKYSGSSGIVKYEDLQIAKRYDHLLEEINQEVFRLTGEKLNLMSYGLGLLYEQEYIGNANLLQNIIETDIGLSVIVPEQIENAVDYRGSGITLADRVEKHGTELIFSIRQELTQGLILGKGYRDITKIISDRLGVDASKASRMVRTESNRIRNQARLEVFQKAVEKGVVMEKEWRSAHDGRTRYEHTLLNGKRKKVDEYFEMSGYRALAPQQFGKARLDVNCRCRIRMVEIDYPLRKHDYEQYKPKPINPKETVVEGQAKSQMIKVQNQTTTKNAEMIPSKETPLERDRRLLEESRQATQKASMELEEMKKRRDDAKSLYEEKVKEVKKVEEEKNKEINDLKKQNEVLEKKLEIERKELEEMKKRYEDKIKRQEKK